jgi:hypothetical protein
MSTAAQSNLNFRVSDLRCRIRPISISVPPTQEKITSKLLHQFPCQLLKLADLPLEFVSRPGAFEAAMNRLNLVVLVDEDRRRISEKVVELAVNLLFDVFIVKTAAEQKSVR